ncbi:MAG: Ig-like domain-containing protein [Myxococcales bacterium]|nr:Ig-like domain-containing protein [Myxococcales bacterium]
MTGVVPADQGVGVDATSNITISFDSPMDRVITEAAFSVSGRNPSSFEFTWNRESTTMTATPIQPLEYAEGILGATVIAKSYTVTVASSARDARGRPLLPFSSIFKTKRLLVGEGLFQSHLSRTLSWSCQGCSSATATYRGELRDIGVGYGDMSRPGAFCVGPVFIQPAFNNWWEEVLISFLIRQVPPAPIVTSAQLTLNQYSAPSMPLPGRKLAVDTVAYGVQSFGLDNGSIPLATEVAVSSGLTVYGSTEVAGALVETGAKTAFVTREVQSAMNASSSKVQFRVRVSPEGWLHTDETTGSCFSQEGASEPSLRFTVAIP